MAKRNSRQHAARPAQPAPRRRPGVFLPVLALALLLTAVLQWVNSPLRTAAAPAGIVSYEFAGQVSRAASILSSWDARARQFAALSLGLDYLYMLAYGLAIALACAWVAGGVLSARGLARSGDFVARASARRSGLRVLAALGVALAWGQVAAVLCDATENVALLFQLFTTASHPWPVVATACATVKFALIALGLLYALGGAIAWLVRRGR